MLALKAVAVRLGSTMFAFLIKLFLIVRSRLRSRANLEAENIVLTPAGDRFKPQIQVAGTAAEPRSAILPLGGIESERHY